ncbi:hypothetical protein ACFOEZ_16030 [Tianweitania populi]|uniref:Preprotein translocase subunit SecY n=1 Tax=Tianweitania populi TaxID=1607949 RepID=A0A8J3GK60_9HYPH|nr:hypothetical protein [Tianweitania populi]GHD15629.1 hypothetical protein GCM10016234_22790 [Tianweitania populi]
MSDTVIQSKEKPAIRRDTTLAAGLVLLVVAIGSHIPVPGLDLAVISEQIDGQTSGVMARLSIMALGILPLYTVLVHAELVRVLIPPLARWQAASPRNAGRLDLIIIILALLLSVLQAWGILVALEQSQLVRHDSAAFVAVGIASFVASTAVLIWLAKMVQLPGLGSSFWLVLVLPYLAGLPEEIALWFEMAGMGGVPASEFLMIAAYVLLGIAGVVFARSSLLRAAKEHRVETSTASAMLIWPVFLASMAAGYLIIPIALISEDPEGLLARIPYAVPVLTTVLIPLFVYAYARSTFLKRLDETQKQALSPVLFAVAGVQIAIFVAGHLLWSTLMLKFSLAGSMLIVATLVMLSLMRTDDPRGQSATA